MYRLICKRSINSSKQLRSSRLLTTLKEDYQYLEKSNEPTDLYQSKLPVLPIPDLDQTCKRYLDAVRPLIYDGNQLSNTEKYVNDFKNKIGKQIDYELRKLNENNLESTYFNQWWDESYLAYRVPIPVNVNPYMILENDPNSVQNPVQRATSLVISLLRYRRSLLDNVLAPEKIEMRPFKKLFSTTRMPRENEDTVEYFGEDKKHVVFLHNGQFYKFNVLDQNGNIKPPSDIFNFIQALSNYEEIDNQSITTFSALNRDKWAELRPKLENLTEKNKKNLNLIDSALFVVCLDDQKYKADDLNSRSLGFLHGTYNTDNLDHLNCLNRWFDKSVQLIITKEGDAGINFEHSWGDGIIILNVLNKLHPESMKFTEQYLNDLKGESNNYNINAFKLAFDLNNDLKNEILNSKEEYKKLVCPVKMSVVNYANMNKNYLKTKNISPDFVFQLAFQLANYKLFTKTAPTYEACSTAKFKMGRTENIRSATMETKLACNAITWGEKKFSYSDLRESLNAGSTKHAELSKLAAAGEGCDRHLFALKSLAKSLDITPTPSIFSDPTYNFVNHFILSTSHLYADNVISGGYGPVVDQGFGLAYGFTKDGLTLNCTSFESQDAEQFAEAFIYSLQEINNVLERSTNSS